MVASRILWRRLRIAAGIALSLALVGWCAWLFGMHWRPSVDAFPIQGIDVDEAHGDIDWWAVKAGGAQFAYIRATRGADVRDTRFAKNWRGSYQAGVRRGALHVFSLCQLAADQAGNFVSTVPRSSDQLAPAVALDFEADCPARPDRDVLLGELARFLVAVESHMGKTAVLRVSRAFEGRYRVSEAVPRAYWSVQPFFPPAYLARPWAIWQANALRRVRGVSGPVNWNVVAP